MIRRAIAAIVVTAALVTAAQGGHELPVYPSYYPHEIEVTTVAPDRAADLLRSGRMHAYVGGTPDFAGTVPETVGAVESLGSFVTARVNPASPHARDTAAACAAVRAAARRTAVNGPMILHPYPVTPFHGDYLHHADRAEAATKRMLEGEAAGADLKLRAAGTPAPQDPWDVAIEEIAVSDLVGGAMTAINGWLGPPWLKAGWYQAYRVLGDGVDGEARDQVESRLRRLQHDEAADAVERINLERDLVADLVAGCRKVVIGYTVKREYFSTEFSAGIENIAYDMHQGFNAPIFIRTVKLKDFPWNGWLALGIGTQPKAAWNPIAGFTDPFGRLIWAAIGDPAALPSPYDAGWALNRISDVELAR
ncbi:hypothetical protein FHP25_14935 [Vineibacter terrae]|uniref:Uncharacterized protein n=1 Tax=Vineibacter terrae TaxID=2586908 RepID=A0A5C8PLV3_9HYPH|nr:hypothetical protein [Vineibacter terrae]TXL75173.1 hypothetical protein FHP25_14935 [Vineibacter terrae]